jgi:hypothetical protein
MSLNPLCGKNSVHWLKVERPLRSGLSTQGLFRMGNTIDILETGTLTRQAAYVAWWQGGGGGFGQ